MVVWLAAKSAVALISDTLCSKKTSPLRIGVIGVLYFHLFSETNKQTLEERRKSAFKWYLIVLEVIDILF